jgi:hypothetical protein
MNLSYWTYRRHSMSLSLRFHHWMNPSSWSHLKRKSLNCLTYHHPRRTSRSLSIRQTMNQNCCPCQFHHLMNPSWLSHQRTKMNLSYWMYRRHSMSLSLRFHRWMNPSSWSHLKREEPELLDVSPPEEDEPELVDPPEEDEERGACRSARR